MIALIDGDIVAYRCACSCEKFPTKAEPEHLITEPVEVAYQRVNNAIANILERTGATSIKVILTGENNFRFKINPEYKANRKDSLRPTYLQAVREYLVTNYGALVSDGEEADDVLGITQCSIPDTVICSIDKDLLMIPGKHYNFVKDEHREVSKLEGIRHFYWQLIMGDKTDNIMGFDGVARQTVPKKLEWAMAELADCLNEAMMFELVRGMYNDDEKMLISGQCLWIRRRENEMWEFPINNGT